MIKTKVRRAVTCVVGESDFGRINRKLKCICNVLPL